jgi:hypothetical protein
MEKSDSIIKLTGALIKAHAEVKVVEKGAENPFFKSKYADLPAITKEYQRVFPKYGLAVIQAVEGKALRTTMLHESGEWISSLADMLVAKQDPQGLGSAITYMRRYCLAAICGIVSSDDDDDGNAGTHQHKSEPAHQAPQTSCPTLKEYTGKMGKHFPPKGASKYHAYTLEGVDGFFQTADESVMETLRRHKDNGDTIALEVEESVNGKYTNRRITGISVIETVAGDDKTLF